MLATYIGISTTSLLTVLFGWLLRIGTQRKSDDAAQMEYLSLWSDMTRLRQTL